MSLLTLDQLPSDYFYFRSHSSIYERYVSHGSFSTIPLGQEFGWMRTIWKDHITIANFERVREEPTYELLRRHWFAHGLVMRTPASSITPKHWWWIRLPYTGFYLDGFTKLENEYQSKWSARARRAQKKYLTHGLEIRSVERELFEKEYAQAHTNTPYKSSFIRCFHNLTAVDPTAFRNFLCYQGSTVVAGMSVFDYSPTSSVHFVAFVSPEGKELQAGTGLIDHRFQTSLEKGLTYLSFDHLKDPTMWRSHSGYTQFKENFMDYTIAYKRTYLRVM